MPDPQLGVRHIFVWDAFGANKIEHLDADRFTEVFQRDLAPSVGDLGVAFQTDEAQYPQPVTVGLGVVHSITGVASGAVRAAFRPVYRFQVPVELEALSSLKRGARSFELPAPFHSTTLSPGSGAALLDELIDSDNGLSRWLTRLSTPERQYSPSIEQAREEARDSVALAAQIAEIELPADALDSDTKGLPDDDLLDTIINSAYQFDMEEELLPLDLQRFDGKLRVDQVAATMAVFTDKTNKRVLSVFCVNKKPLEEEMGVDLFYWDKINDVMTFVQYKRLEKITSTDAGRYEWAYKREKELTKQLSLMPAGSKKSLGSKDWRMTDSPFWFKFVRGDAAIKSPKKVLKGMYIPADWLRLAIGDGSLRTGPKRGFRVTYENAKYIGRQAFTHLVSRGLIGTTSVQSQDFKEVLKNLGDRQVIVAVRSTWSNVPSAEAPENSGSLFIATTPF